jgi:hypothetical protein
MSYILRALSCGKERRGFWKNPIEEVSFLADLLFALLCDAED